MPSTKVRPKTGAAAPEDEDQPVAITDAQAADWGPGFTTPPSPPGPSGPSYGMGGEVTQPSDFAREVATATNVPSKGGPPVEELYASSGKGPVGKLKKPQASESTTKAPEEMAPPKLDLSAWGSITAPSPTPAAASATPTPAAASATPTTTPAATATPAATPTATPAATPTGTPAAAATPGAATTVEEPAKVDPTKLPAFLDHGPMIQKYAASEQRGPQDYSELDAYTTNDPNFAGTRWGKPIFMDNADHKVYMRDETAPGKEIRHYADAAPGTHEADNGVPFENTDKVTAAQEAHEQMQSLLQAQESINNWKQKLIGYQQKFGDEPWWQRAAVEAKMSGDTGWQATLAKTAAGWAGVTPDMESLDAAREQLKVPYIASFTKGKEGLRIPSSEVEGMPTANDDFTTQLTKVRAMEAKLQTQAKSLQTLYPNASKDSNRLLQMVKTGLGQKEIQPSASASPAATPTATPAATPTPSSRKQPTHQEAQSAPVVRTPEDVKKYPSGTLVRDGLDGRLKYIP